jgi:hypothetical protein
LLLPLRPGKSKHQLRPYTQVIATVPHDDPTPLFEPNRWNDDGPLQTTANGYAYALNRPAGSNLKTPAASPNLKTQAAASVKTPPDQTQTPLAPIFTALDKETLTKAILEDGRPDKIIPALRSAEDQEARRLPPNRDGYYLMALVTTSQDGFDAAAKTFHLADFHCYRRDADGGWSHKPGRGPVSRLDSNERIIDNPETAARRQELGTINIPPVGPVPAIVDYDIFCGYFYVKK